MVEVAVQYCYFGENICPQLVAAASRGWCFVSWQFWWFMVTDGNDDGVDEVGWR